MNLFEELQWRGLVKQVTSEMVAQFLNSQVSRTFYCGFDPTANSLHVGSLLPLTMMKRLQMAGHNPLAILGVSTAAIGDPSFKSTERKLLSEQDIKSNIVGIRKNIESILTCELIENDWFAKMSVIDFLRGPGKAFTVNHMMAKESVRSRLNDRDQGISFTEFSYMILQAQDFMMLANSHNCVLQIGGSDQWGNITAGIDLCRKELNKEVFGMTMPLLTKSDGTKFGKSEGGNIWLSADKTSPFDFFQFFVRTEDADVINLLKMLTFLSKEDIESLEKSLKTEPHLRKAQKALANELTKMVHGEVVLNEVLEKTKTFFFQGTSSLSPDMTKDRSEVVGKKVVDILVEIGFSPSKTMARKDIEAGAVWIHQTRISDIQLSVDDSHVVDGLFVIKRGKKSIKVIKIS